jgi:pyruvate dehydrogenase E1 component alpha subunit
VRADGMNPDEVRDVTKAAVDRARAGEGPTLIEVITYRFRGHSMADPVQYRQKDEEERWKLQDPIVRWKAHLLDIGVTEEEIARRDAEAVATVDAAVEFADSSPFPTEADLFSDTYAPAEWVERFHLNQQH